MLYAIAKENIISRDICRGEFFQAERIKYPGGEIDYHIHFSPDHNPLVRSLKGDKNDSFLIITTDDEFIPAARFLSIARSLGGHSACAGFLNRLRVGSNMKLYDGSEWLVYATKAHTPGIQYDDVTDTLVCSYEQRRGHLVMSIRPEVPVTLDRSPTPMTQPEPEVSIVTRLDNHRGLIEERNKLRDQKAEIITKLSLLETQISESTKAINATMTDVYHFDTNHAR